VHRSRNAINVAANESTCHGAHHDHLNIVNTNLTTCSNFVERQRTTTTAALECQFHDGQ
jgi:hypothetical protein